MQAQVYQFAAEPQVSHPKYRDEDIYDDLTDLPEDESNLKPDYYVDRPPTPEYKPIERGIDVSTQIEQYEPELFDYLLEVEPVLQVLVGKSMELARMELIEELEAEQLRVHKRQFEKKRNAELMVTQRMEAAYLRRREERERRVLQHQLNHQQMKLSQQKFIARQLAKLSLRGTKQRLLGDLDNLGYLRNDQLQDLQVISLPWLIERVKFNTNRNIAHHDQFIRLLDEVQIPVQNQHQEHYAIEINRRNEILAERERVRIEIEERKKRKVEIKRRRAIKEKREVQRSAIYNNTIAKAEQANSIFQVSIFEGMAEIGQRGVVLPCDLLLLLAQCLDKIVGDDIDQIDEQIVGTILLDLLMNKSAGLVINLNSNLQVTIQEALVKMEEDLMVFEKTMKQQLIQQLLETQPLWSSFICQQRRQSIRTVIVNKLLAGLFDIYFKSVNYKEPPQQVPVEQKQKTDEQPSADQQQNDNPADQPVQPQELDAQPVQQPEQEEYQKPEITQHDLHMVEARKKLKINFKQPQSKLDKANAVINLLVPWFANEEPEQVDQQLQQSQQQSLTPQPGIEKQPSQQQLSLSQQQISQQQVSQQQSQQPVGKWDFDPKTIDIYDGDQPLIQEGNRTEVDSLMQYTFQEPVYVNDQRTLEFATAQIYQYLKEQLESFMNVPELSTLQLETQQIRIADIPIYDYEL